MFKGRDFAAGRNRFRYLLYAAAGLSIVLGGGAFWLSSHWPFTQAAVQKDLQQRLDGRLTIGSFRQTWFPPGFVARDLHVRYPDGADRIKAQDLIVRGSWHGLLTHSLEYVKIVALFVDVPPAGARSLFRFGSPTKVRSLSRIEFNNSGLKSDAAELIARQIVLDHVGAGETVAFRALLDTQKPPGELSGEGKAGPFRSGQLNETPISGVYRFRNADLHAFSDLFGILSSEGNFRGTLARVYASGDLDVPHFHIAGSHHDVDFKARYSASVDTRNADTEFPQVEATVAHTRIDARGSVKGEPGRPGKTARADLAVDNGRTEDLLNYFSSEEHASMTGPVRLRAHAELPPGSGFLARLLLTGEFSVSGGRFTAESDQRPINELSATAKDKAQGVKESKVQRDSETALTQLGAHVNMRHGDALLTDMSLRFPGADAQMAGTFHTLARTVDIHGTLRTTGTLSQSASGIKELFLKVATPFLKKKDVTVVPFSITGTTSHPKIGLELKRKKQY